MAIDDDASIERLALKMMDRSLPRAEWTHAGHFATALWLIKHRPDLAEPAAMRLLIMRYNDATGTENSDTSGYHHTITTASMRGAAHHLQCTGQDAPLCVVLAALMASNLGQSGWLLEHWDRQTLFSPAARRTWIEPDLAALPF